MYNASESRKKVYSSRICWYVHVISKVGRNLHMNVHGGFKLLFYTYSVTYVTLSITAKSQIDNKATCKSSSVLIISINCLYDSLFFIACNFCMPMAYDRSKIIPEIRLSVVDFAIPIWERAHVPVLTESRLRISRNK